MHYLILFFAALPLLPFVAVVVAVVALAKGGRYWVLGWLMQ